ncbi:GlxA family transcriptional regulator [Streptomyces platensis]|uniref:GlxA family transcriptional regulator n=1 Tax=Streptomyces platensis TaxID=58346 RepID=UPI003869BD82|nr:helix-turn-helix domain-containing protein [Streptomyces platensis]
MGNTVALALAEHVSLIELAAPCEIFGVDRSQLTNSWYDFIICGSENARVGGWFRPDGYRSLDKLVTAHTVIVPGSRNTPGKQPAELVEAVRAAHDAGARIVSVCAGAFVLAAAGLLDGRRATTHWLYADLLAARYPQVNVDPDVLYVDDGDILTSAGKLAGIDMCLHLVRLDYGAAVANDLARRLIMPPLRDGDQAQFIAPLATQGIDHALAELLPWVKAHLDEPLTVVDLARRVNMSTRTLSRHFNAVTGKTPLQWLLTQRIQQAQELLETSSHSIEQIAALTGMGTAATLRRHFSRAVGMPPDAYRRAFRAGQAPVKFRPVPQRESRGEALPQAS